MMFARQAARAALLAILASTSIALFAHPVAADALDANLTGIPAYPNLKSASMMGGKNPNGCMVYSMQSMDSLDTVVAWYLAHGSGTPVMTKNGWGGTQADFGLHDRKQLLAFTSPRLKNSGVSISASKNCGHVNS
jgi:uncharacterized protein YeaC (DUF1315 family)